MTARAASVAAIIAFFLVLGQAETPLAQDTRSLPPADRVPLHSVVDVGALPPPPPQDSSDARIKIRPRLMRSPKEPREGLAAPVAPEVTPPPVSSTRLSSVSMFEGLANSDNGTLTGSTSMALQSSLVVGS